MTDVEASRLGSSKVVTTVFEEILVAVNNGTLQPGQRINDAELAERFGVSRTPVREALQRLRDIGIVEASASRFTRIADVTPEQTAQSYVVWLALYRALVEEMVPRASDSALALLEDDHKSYLEAIAALDPICIAMTNFDFFSRLVAESSNPALQRAITSVVHVVRLGSLHLPQFIDVVAVGNAQAMIIEAVRGQDIELARQAMKVLARVQVPLE